MSVVYVILNIFDKATPQQKKIPKTKPGYKSIVNWKKKLQMIYIK